MLLIEQSENSQKMVLTKCSKKMYTNAIIPRKEKKNEYPNTD